MTFLKPPKVLVVEDEMLVAMLIEDMLTDLGLEVVGPAMRLSRAMEFAEEESFDFAILDVNLANEQSFPVAHVLRERGIPFIFATGYGRKGLINEFAAASTLQKPFGPHELKQAISGVLGG